MAVLDGRGRVLTIPSPSQPTDLRPKIFDAVVVRTWESRDRSPVVFTLTLSKDQKQMLPEETVDLSKHNHSPSIDTL